jgi:hypothetical protein
MLPSRSDILNKLYVTVSPWKWKPRHHVHKSSPLIIHQQSMKNYAKLQHTKHEQPSLMYASCCMSLCGIIAWPSTQRIPNKWTNITALTFVYYSVFATCFYLAGWSSGSSMMYHSLFNCVLIWIYFSNYININFVINSYVRQNITFWQIFETMF